MKHPMILTTLALLGCTIAVGPDPKECSAVEVDVAVVEAELGIDADVAAAEFEAIDGIAWAPWEGGAQLSLVLGEPRASDYVGCDDPSVFDYEADGTLAVEGLVDGDLHGRVFVKSIGDSMQVQGSLVSWDEKPFSELIVALGEDPALLGDTDVRLSGGRSGGGSRSTGISKGIM